MVEISDAPAHAKYAPSAASRWPECNASVDFADTEPRDQFVIDAATWGSEVHESITAGSSIMPHWTDQQKQDARLCFAEWAKHVPAQYDAEVKLFSKRWPQLFFGTLDALWLEGTCVNITDLKTGLRGVSAVENAQLLAYACLAADKYPDAESFRLTIIQPRRYYVDSNTYSRAQVAKFAEKIAAAIESPKTFRAGSWCEFCPHRNECPTLQAYLLALLADAKTLGLWSDSGLTWLKDFCDDTKPN